MKGLYSYFFPSSNQSPKPLKQDSYKKSSSVNTTIGTDEAQLLTNLNNKFQKLGITISAIQKKEDDTGFILDINKKGSSETKQIEFVDIKKDYKLNDIESKTKFSSRLADFNKLDPAKKEDIFKMISAHFLTEETCAAPFAQDLAITPLNVDTTLRHKELIKFHLDKMNEKFASKKHDMLSSLNKEFKEFDITIKELTPTENGFNLTVNSKSKPNQTKLYKLIQTNGKVRLEGPTKDFSSFYKKSRLTQFNSSSLKQQIFNETHQIFNTFKTNTNISLAVNLTPYFGEDYKDATISYDPEKGLVLTFKNTSDMPFTITCSHTAEITIDPKLNTLDKSVIKNCFAHCMDLYDTTTLTLSDKPLRESEIDASYVPKIFNKETPLCKDIQTKLLPELNGDTIESITHNKKTGHITLKILDEFNKTYQIELKEESAWLPNRPNKFVVKGKFKGITTTEKLLDIYKDINSQNKVTRTPKRKWSDFFKDMFYTVTKSTSDQKAETMLLTKLKHQTTELKYIQQYCSKQIESNQETEFYEEIKSDCDKIIEETNALNSHDNNLESLQYRCDYLDKLIPSIRSEITISNKDLDKDTFEHNPTITDQLRQNGPKQFKHFANNRIALNINTLVILETDPDAINSQFLSERLLLCSEVLLKPPISAEDKQEITDLITQSQDASLTQLEAIKAELDSLPNLEEDPSGSPSVLDDLKKDEIKTILKSFHLDLTDVNPCLDTGTLQDVSYMLETILDENNYVSDSTKAVITPSKKLKSTIETHINSLESSINLIKSYYKNNKNAFKSPVISTLLTEYDTMHKSNSSPTKSIEKICEHLNLIQNYILDNYKDISNTLASALIYDCSNSTDIKQTVLFKPYYEAWDKINEEITTYSKAVLPTIDSLQQYKTRFKTDMFDKLKNYSTEDVTPVINDIITNFSELSAFRDTSNFFGDKVTDAERFFISGLTLETGLTVDKISQSPVKKSIFKSITSSMSSQPVEAYNKISLNNTDYFIKNKDIPNKSKAGRLTASDTIMKKEGKNIFYFDERYVWVKTKDNTYKFIDHTTEDPDQDNLLQKMFPDIFNNISRETFFEVIKHSDSLATLKESHEYEESYADNKANLEAECKLEDYKKFMTEQGPLSEDYLQKKYPLALFQRIQ